MATSAVGSQPGGPPRAGESASAGRIGNEEYHSAPVPPAQEAAVLYSASLAESARAILKAETRNPARRNDRQPWLMLFDLFEVTHDRQEFDSLAMLFTAKFDHPAPAWGEGDEATVDPRRARARERNDFFALTPDPMGELAPEIERLAAFAETTGTVRIDLGSVPSITARESESLTAALQRLRRAGMPVWLNNAEGLERVLRVALNENAPEATRSFWLLLFELDVLQGRRQDFEELALEYAVALDASPPRWQVYENPVPAAAPTAAPVPAAHEGSFALKGVISSASQDQFAELADHAALHAEVVVDMAKVLRVDFAAIAAYFGAVKAIHLAGKRIILTNLSELNAVLLEAFDFNRHAILIRRRAN